MYGNPGLIYERVAVLTGVWQACDMCRKKKIKCDGKQPKCSHCINYKTECIFTQVEKKRNPPKGSVVDALSVICLQVKLTKGRAKYIEGLENRLGRMESLLKLSGLLNEDDGDRTDLGMLEKRLADKTNSQSADGSPGSGSKSISSPQTVNGSDDTTPQQAKLPTPRRSASPEALKEAEEEVEALSDMMCSLVTNNCGETKYIGKLNSLGVMFLAQNSQGHLLAFPYSRLRVYNGSVRRRVTIRFRI